MNHVFPNFNRATVQHPQHYSTRYLHLALRSFCSSHGLAGPNDTHREVRTLLPQLRLKTWTKVRRSAAEMEVVPAGIASESRKHQHESDRSVATTRTKPQKSFNELTLDDPNQPFRNGDRRVRALPAEVLQRVLRAVLHDEAPIADVHEPSFLFDPAAHVPCVILLRADRCKQILHQLDELAPRGPVLGRDDRRLRLKQLDPAAGLDKRAEVEHRAAHTGAGPEEDQALVHQVETRFERGGPRRVDVLDLVLEVWGTAGREDGWVDICADVFVVRAYGGGEVAEPETWRENEVDAPLVRTGGRLSRWRNLSFL